MNRRSGIESRQLILDAALKTISANGYGGTNIRAIAKRAGISVGCVYLHFKNKEELCLTLFKSLHEDFIQSIKGALSSVDNPVEAVSAYVGTYMEAAARYRELIIAVIFDRSFQFGKEVKRDFLRSQWVIVGDMVKRGVDSGVFGPCDVNETTRIIMGVLRGYIMSIIIDDENRFSHQGCAQFLLNGLLSR